MKAIDHRGTAGLLAAIILLSAGSARSIAMAADFHPILEASSGSGTLLGAVVDGKYVPHEKAVALLQGDETYDVYSLTKRIGKSAGGKPRPEDVGDAGPQITLSPAPASKVIAIAAPWNAQPRLPKTVDPTQPVYLAAVRTLLEEHGLKDPAVKIAQILRVDLDGDGEEEVLITATNYFTKDNDPPMRSPRGSYSFVILRQTVGGEVKTKLLEGDFHPKAYMNTESFDAPGKHAVSAILDLNGDGKMEVIIESSGHEWGSTKAYDCLGGKPKELLKAEWAL